MPNPPESELIYDWNRSGEMQEPAPIRVELNDETLRDGLQSPSVKTPSIKGKLEILHEIAGLGIESVNIGLPAAGLHVVESVTRLAREIVDQKLPLAPNCAARTMRGDIEPIVRISEKVGIPIEAACFLGSSPIRQYAESWNIESLEQHTRDAVGYAVESGLPVMFVTEDTTRARPEDLTRLYTAAVEAGAERVCVADTVGHATPTGAGNVVRFVRSVVDSVSEGVKIDWHGHKDRALSVANSIAAAEAGADRLHATALGIGERCGNTPMEALLVNLVLMGWIDRDLSGLPGYCRLVSRATGVGLPENYPIVGGDAFRTGTGVHAAAIIKAREKGEAWLADRIYSGVPAGLLGRRQRIEVGPMSGKSNVVYWLEEHGAEPIPELVEEVFRRAKESSTVLDDDEIRAICSRLGAAVDP